MKLDEYGDSLWLKYYDDVDKDDAFHLEVLENAKILIFGNGSIAPNHRHHFLMQTDQDGNKEWEKILELNTLQALGGEFARLPDGSLAVAFRQSLPTSKEETLALAKLDSLGNVIWLKTYQTNELAHCDVKMKPLNNGGFALSYCFHNWQAGQVQMKIYVLDSLGEVQWEYPFYTKPARITYGLNTASNGDIIGCGVRLEDDGSYGWLFRLSPEGELLWQRSYLPESKLTGFVLSSFRDLVETPDGGIAATGVMDDSLGNSTTANVWLLKVAADGCFTPGCTDSILTASVERHGHIFKSERQVFFRLSPNPVGGQARLAFFSPAPKHAAVRVFNAQGQPVREVEVPPGSGEAEVDFTGQAAGLYLVRYEVAGRVLQAEKVVQL